MKIAESKSDNILQRGGATFGANKGHYWAVTTFLGLLLALLDAPCIRPWILCSAPKASLFSQNRLQAISDEFTRLVYWSAKIGLLGALFWKVVEKSWISVEGRTRVLQDRVFNWVESNGVDCLWDLLSQNILITNEGLWWQIYLS